MGYMPKFILFIFKIWQFNHRNEKIFFQDIIEKQIILSRYLTWLSNQLFFLSIYY